MSSANSVSAPKAVPSEKPESSSGDTLDAAGTAPPSSSSYAKMLNPKAGAKQQSDRETIADKDAPKTTKPNPTTEEPAKPVAAIKEIKPQPEAAAGSSTASAENAKQIDETGVEAEEDDPTFIPVVSQHIRKQNKHRERPAAAPAKSRGGPAHAAAPAKFAGPASQEKSRRNDRPERKERRAAAVAVEKEAKVEKDGASTKTEVPNEQVSVKTTNEEDKAKEESVKFVEAPIPVVNAWKLEKEVSFALNCIFLPVLGIC